MKFKNPVTQAERQNQIQRWLQDRLGERPGLVELAGDASFRRYYRVKASRQSFVLMDAQLDDENVKQFVFVTKLLQRSGLHVPTIEHADLQNDLLLLEDLGDRLLLNCLNKGNAKGFYFQAVKDLLLIQHANTDGLSLYSEAKLRKEMEIFKDWLCGQYLGYRRVSAVPRLERKACCQQVVRPWAVAIHSTHPVAKAFGRNSSCRITRLNAPVFTQLSSGHLRGRGGEGAAGYARTSEVPARAKTCVISSRHKAAKPKRSLPASCRPPASLCRNRVLEQTRRESASCNQ